MAKAVSSEELQLRKRARRRLVGAVALVVLVVVFLPMILDNEPKPLSEDIAINIPSSPGEEDNSDSMPSEPQPLHFRAVESGSDDSDSRSQANTSSDEAASASSASDEIKPIEPIRTEPARTGSAKTKAADEGYVVQLGAFSDAGNALRLAKMVDDARFTAYTEEVTTSGGKRTRVRVGPYSTRAAAEEASKRLKARKLTYGEPVIVRSTD